jgi:hypothetical protein
MLKDLNDKDSKDEREKFVIENFGIIAVAIRSSRVTVEDLQILMHFINDVVKEKRGG